MKITVMILADPSARSICTILIKAVVPPQRNHTGVLGQSSYASIQSMKVIHLRFLHAIMLFQVRSLERSNQFPHENTPLSNSNNNKTYHQTSSSDNNMADMCPRALMPSLPRSEVGEYVVIFHSILFSS